MGESFVAKLLLAAGGGETCRVSALGAAILRPTFPAMTEPPDDNLDHYALGFYAPGKGLRREDCPYADGTEPHAQWTTGYDAAVKEGEGAKER